MTVTVQAENISEQMSAGQTYFSFSLNLIFPGLGYVKTSGWRYFPSTGTVGAPGRNKGNGRWTPIQWLEGPLYKQVVNEIQRYFIFSGLCEEPWEVPEQRKATLEARKKA